MLRTAPNASSGWSLTDLDQSRVHNKVNEIDTDDDHSTGPGASITENASGSGNWSDPVYDAAGNMTTMPSITKAHDKPMDILIYDAWNRLVEISNDEKLVQSNEYDGLHRRIVRHEDTDGDGTLDTNGEDDHRHFYYNENWQCLEERVEVSSTIDPHPIKQYVWHPYYIDALAVSYYDENTDDAGIVQHFYLHDANFNVTAAVNDSGTVVERYAYTPYGEATVLDTDFDEDADNESDIGNEFLYTGRRLDPVTGLQQSRYRYYHAQLGRFVNRDPIGYRGGMNLYEYVGGMPTRFADPAGLAGEEPKAPENCKKTCNYQNWGNRYGESLGVFVSGGPRSPNVGNNSINVLLFLVAFNEVAVTGPVSDLVDQLPGYLTGNPGDSELEAIQHFAEIKQLQNFWARVNGERFSVWVKVQCRECECINPVRAKLGFQKRRFAYVDDGKPKWVMCDLTKTSWADEADKKPGAWFDNKDNLVYWDMLRKSDIEQIEKECEAQASCACKQNS